MALAALSMVVLSGAGGAPPVKTITELPDGWTVAWRGDTIQDLAEKSGAIVRFGYVHGETMLVWTGVGKTGKRWFSMGTARQYAPKGRRPAWIVARHNGTMIEDGDGLLPIVEAGVGSGPPVERNMTVSAWAREVGRSEAMGTLFEMEVYFHSFGEGALGSRVLLLQDAKGGWKYAGVMEGDFWDETGWQTKTRLNVEWTGKAESPMELRVERAEGGDRERPEPDSIQWLTVEHYRGSLPFWEPAAEDDYVEVKKGQTFSGIVMAMVAWEAQGNGEKVQLATRRLLAERMVAMNPGLEVDQVKVGQRLRVPDKAGRTALKRIPERLGELRG
jgi:hypothetical protein